MELDTECCLSISVGIEDACTTFYLSSPHPSPAIMLVHSSGVKLFRSLHISVVQYTADRTPCVSLALKRKPLAGLSATCASITAVREAVERNRDKRSSLQRVSPAEEEFVPHGERADKFQ
ncbi:hypothetical protein RRG08_033187 [Elysia crispata]|uniref:Uncharacterized protein n=1 Tax=Elysia crispata TaxID=231223 RepID=A0AAE1EE15_9GAST|nr:hypothetical protein RRG08_033187 [Elysia crispata]